MLVSLTSGDLSTSAGWMASRQPAVCEELDFPYEEERRALAYLLVAHGQYGSAIDFLARLHVFAEAQGRFNRAILMLALKAKAFHLSGQHDQALATLERGLTLGAPGGYVCAFVDQGEPMHSLIDEIVADDYIRHESDAPFPVRGPGDVKRLVTLLRTMLPDLTLEVEDMVAEGDKVVSRYTGVATDTHGYMGMPPTGKTIRTLAIQIFRFAGGKIVESWAVRDDLGVLRQLGHLPPLGLNNSGRQ
jgi:hypothetical protein